MRPARIVAVAALLGVLAVPAGAIAGVRDDKPNLIGGELLGRGVITLNYERFLSNHFGLGGGLMVIGGGSGGVTAIVPLYASFVPGDVHSLYLSGGATIGLDSSSDLGGQWAMTAALGYQFHSPGGFFVRPMFAYLVDTSSPDSFLIWPGLTIGGSF